MARQDQQTIETHHRLETNKAKLEGSLELKNCHGFSGLECPDIRLVPNGLLFASGSQIVEQNLTDKTQTILQAHTKTVQCLDISKDKRFVASAQVGPNGQIKIFDRKDYLCIFSWVRF